MTGGADSVSAQTVECPECEGKGWQPGIEHDQRCAEVGGCFCEGVQVQEECPMCHGAGRLELLPSGARAELARAALGARWSPTSERRLAEALLASEDELGDAREHIARLERETDWQTLRGDAERAEARVRELQDALRISERSRAEYIEETIRLREERNLGTMTHRCRNEDCGTVEFGAGYKGLCPSCGLAGKAAGPGETP